MDKWLLSMLKARRREFVHRFPQVACFAFDHISAEIAVHGRYGRAELDCYASEISVA